MISPKVEGHQRLLNCVDYLLSLSDLEHFGLTHGTYTLGRWLTILHRDGFGILHFSVGATFHTIALH